MSDPLDDVAESEEAIAFDAFVAMLKNDDDFARVFQTVVAWEDGTEDTAYPTDAEGNWIRLTPQSGASRRLTRNDVDSPMVIAVETCVAGLDARRRMRAWAVIRRAIGNINDNFTSELAKVGVRDVKFAKPAYGVDVIPAESNGLVISVGSITLTLNVPG